MPRLTRSFPIRQRRVSNKGWAFTQSVTEVTVAAATKVLLATISLSNPGIGETILRSRGHITWFTDNPTATELQIGAFGAIIVSDPAVAIGITAIPGPGVASEGGDDGWFIHQTFSSKTLVANVDMVSHTIEIDSKAKRKIDDGFAAAFVVENVQSAQGMRVMFAMRVLSQLTMS